MFGNKTKTVDGVVGKLKQMVEDLYAVQYTQIAIEEAQQLVMDTAQVTRREAEVERERAVRIANKLEELIS